MLKFLRRSLVLFTNKGTFSGSLKQQPAFRTITRSPTKPTVIYHEITFGDLDQKLKFLQMFQKHPLGQSGLIVLSPGVKDMVNGLSLSIGQDVTGPVIQQFLAEFTGFLLKEESAQQKQDRPYSQPV